MAIISRHFSSQRTAYLAAFLLLWGTGLAAVNPPVLRAVRITGNSSASSRDISSWISSRIAAPYVPAAVEADLRAISANYHRLGFLNASVRVAGLAYGPDSATVEMDLAITEERRTVVGWLSINDLRLFPESEALEQFETRPGDPLDQAVLEQDLMALTARCEKLGYPLAQCRVENLSVRPGEESDFLDVTLRIEEGEKVRIDEIRVEGNRETSTEVIVRETRLKWGEPFDPARVNAIKPRLNRLNIFSSVSEPELYLRGGVGGLLIRVQEGSTNTFDGILGYMPSPGPGQSGYLTGLVSVSMRNLFGSGRKLAFRWQREDRSSQELSLRYAEPWIFGLPVNVGGGFTQRKQDSTYVRRILDLRAELMLSEELSVGLILGSEAIIPSADTTVQRTLRSSAVTVGAEVQYDTRDDIYSPVTGVRYRADYHYGRKKADHPENPVRSTLQRFSLDLDLFFPAFHRQVVAIGIHARQVKGGDIQDGELIRFGGTNSLRGYRENQFLGSQVVWTNAEYRFLTGRRSFLFGFLDTGYYLRPDDELRGIPGSKSFKLGYGFGIRLDTALGIMGVSFALGQGDTFSTAKIHFGLINEF
jgi:outer membrane protein insertion porin family